MNIDKQLTTHNCDYSLQVRADSHNLAIAAEDLTSLKRWTGEFSAQFVEDLTHKTGNFKRFNVFTKMLATALEDRSSAVSIDLLSYGDLEMLKSGRKVVGPNDSGKKYLILTYIGEFDKVHYPLPLNFEEINDPSELKALVGKLRREVDMLKRGLPKDRQDSYHLWQENLSLREQLAHTKRHADPGQIEELKRTVLQLEDELAFTKKDFGREVRTLKIQKIEAETKVENFSAKLDDILTQVEADAADRELSKYTAQENETLKAELKSARDEIAKRKKEGEAVKADLQRSKDTERRLQQRIEGLEVELQKLIHLRTTKSDITQYRSFVKESPLKRTPLKSPVKSDSSNKSSPAFSSPYSSKQALSKHSLIDSSTDYPTARINQQVTKVQALISANRA